MTQKATRLGDHIFRAAAALVAGRARPDGEGAYLRQREKEGDTLTALLVRTAVNPATTANTPALIGSIVIDYLANLAPASAAGALIARCVNVRQSGDGQFGVVIPSFKPKLAAGAFVKEGDPIPVEQFVVSGPTMLPRKMGMISGLTQEMARSTNAEALIRQVMTDSSALTLDAAVFCADAATDAQPAGLLYGLVPIAGKAGGDDAAFRGDMVALMSALAVNVRSAVVLVANPVTALKIALLGAGDLPFDVLATERLPADMVVAIGTPGLVFAADTDPKIDVSAEATIHFEDNTPLAISAAGTPNTVAAPVRSLFQTAQIAIRLLLDVNWCTRTEGTVAVLTGATW